jgi:L-ascorbate metabolism protein UlaG (beta-lactamase superfamily)
MIKISLSAKRVILLTLILNVMVFHAKSQTPPSSDIIRTGSGDVEITFIGHGSLIFRMDNMNIYIDPVSSFGDYSGFPKADLILVTHEHSDHLDTDLIGQLRKENTIIICNGAAASKVKGSRVMQTGESQLIKDVKVEGVAAYNIVNMRSPGQPFHPKGVGVGYILNFGGKKFYIAGDTENTQEMKALKNIDVAFLPMNLPYTMTPEMVADAALAFRPKILYPYHFGETNTDRIVQLLKNSGIDVRIRNLK